MSWKILLLKFREQMGSKEKSQSGKTGNSQGIEENRSFNNIRHEDNQFPKNLKELKELKANHLADRFPNVPDHARGKAKPYSDRTANGLTHAIKEDIELMGGQCERIANMGRALDNRYSYTDVLGHSKTIGSVKYIPGTGTNGTADLSATIDGRSIKIEVKISKDRMSEAQKHYRDKVEAAGGIYIVARTFEQFAQELERRLNDG